MKKKYKCEFCGEGIEGFKESSKHKVICEERIKNFEYECICGKKIFGYKNFQDHKKSCSIFINYKNYCKVCGDEIGLKIIDGKVVEKTLCDKKECRTNLVSKRFSKKSWGEERKEKAYRNKIWHKDKIKKEGVFVCNRCNKIFESNTSLRAHKATCGKSKNNICSFCGEIFKSKAGLKNHMISKHDDSERAKEILKRKREGGKRAIKKSILKNKHIYTSKLEDYFFDNFLEEYCSSFTIIKQFRIIDKDFNFVYDFLIEDLRLIIEIDGDYWHLNPKKININKAPKYLVEYKIKELEKENLAKYNNYFLIRFWEDNIYKKEEKIKSLLNRILKK